jgi:hypothetical protein
MTYKELGEAIGYTEGNLKKSVFDKKISSPLKKSIELYLEIIELKKYKEKTKAFKHTLKSFMSDES